MSTRFHPEQKSHLYLLNRVALPGPADSKAWFRKRAPAGEMGGSGCLSGFNGSYQPFGKFWFFLFYGTDGFERRYQT